MKRKLLGMALFACGTMLGAWNIGISIGAPPPPRVVVRTVSPGPGYTFVEGYWYPVSGHYRWHAGYWTRPPYAGAVWIAPHHDGRQYFDGYWKGEGHEPIEHDHASDHRKVRDYRDEHR